MEKKTEKEVKKAYGLARKMGRRFMATHPRPLYHLDEDDYTQEAIIAWLEKKHIPYKLVDLYRKSSPISRRDWVVNKESLKLYDPMNIEDASDVLPSDSDVEGEADKQLKLRAIQKVVDDMIDPRQQVIVILKYGFDKSLIEIAARLNLSKSYTSKLHLEALDHIKKEIGKNDRDN